MKKRPPLWKRLVLSIVTGAAVAAAMRAVQARRAPQRQAAAVPAPSTEWPPLPDLAAAAAPPPSPEPVLASSPDPTAAASPVSAVVVTPAVRIETPSPADAPADSSTSDDEVDARAGVATAPTVRVPGDGPGGALGSIVTDEGAGHHERLDDRSEEGADSDEHLVTNPEPEAVLPDERIDRAREEQPLLADGDDDVPPAPEPTFGTVPDPEAAAEAPVAVATPVEVEPEEELPIPHRAPADGTTGARPAPTPVRSDPASAASPDPEPAAVPKAKRGSSSAKASAKAARAEGTGDRAALTPWIVPSEDGCPGSHPVKAELSQGRFHVPGGTGYDAATADRCYLDAGAAEADGLRPADG